MSFTVYILACSDGSFHSGVTKNLEKRLAYHERGENNDTRSQKPLHLVFEKSFTDIRTAIDFENSIQSKPAKEVKEVIAGNLEIPIMRFENHSAIDQIKLEKSIILPSTYLGNLAYYKEVQQHEIVIDAYEVFQKQTYRNRCSILTANGIQNLSVPVIRPNGKTTIMAHVLISYAENWQKDHVKALESAYGRSPYYEFYAQDLFAIIEKKHIHLIDLNTALMQFLIQAFDWNITVHFSNEAERCSVAHKILVTKQGGSEFSSKPYPQVLNEPGAFSPNLSILDLLFNCGKVKTDAFL